MSDPVGKSGVVRALIGQPEVIEGLRRADRKALIGLESALVALAEPNSVLMRFTDQVMTTFGARAQRGQGLAEPELELFLDRLAGSMALALRDVRGNDEEVVAVPQGGVFAGAARARAVAGDAARTTVFADTAALASALYSGLADVPGAGIADARVVRAGLSAEASEKLSTRMKDLNALLFTPACLELARRASTVRADAPLPSLGVEVAIREAVGMPDFVKSALELLPVRGLTRAPRRLELANAFGAPLPGAVVTTLPVGAWPDGDGERLAAALLRAVHLLMGVTHDMASMFDTQAHREALGAITFQRDGATLLREGLATTAQSVALLLAHPPAAMTLDGALEALERSPLISTFALAAPIGVVQPLAIGGYLPDDPFTVGDGGRLVLPASLKTLLRAIHGDRVLPSRDANTRSVAFGMYDEAPNMAETKRGCPVAGRVLEADGRGGVVLSEKTPLQELSAALIALTREILRGPPVPVVPKLDMSAFR